MSISVLQHVEAARIGAEPALVCQVPSGWVTLCTLQFLRGYCILMPDPVVPSLNDLDWPHRAEFLCDMAMVGDALLEATGAYRINYTIAGNSDPFLHAHIVPRYLDEPDELRRGLPWSYAQDIIDTHLFDENRDQELIYLISKAIRKRL